MAPMSETGVGQRVDQLKESVDKFSRTSTWLSIAMIVVAVAQVIVGVLSLYRP